MLSSMTTDDASARLTAGPARRPATARPASVHPSDPGPFVAGGPSGPGGRLLLLQRQVGNAAVQAMLWPPDEVTVARQRVPPAYTAPPPGSPPPPGRRPYPPATR